MFRHFNIKIYGLVQGVFFRATAKEQADKLSITGFARNESAGSVYFSKKNSPERQRVVYIEAEGEENNLNKFVKWCNMGPSMAQVEKVIVTEGELKNFSDFSTF